MSFANCTMHEWNGHVEIFSRPQVIEISRQYLLLRTDILQTKVVGCPCWFCMKQANQGRSQYEANRGTCLSHLRFDPGSVLCKRSHHKLKTLNS